MQQEATMDSVQYVKLNKNITYNLQFAISVFVLNKYNPFINFFVINCMLYGEKKYCVLFNISCCDCGCIKEAWFRKLQINNVIKSKKKYFKCR